VGEHVRRMSKGKIIPVLNKAQRHENVWESGGIAQHVLKPRR